jgi:hypothetical protein
MRKSANRILPLREIPLPGIHRELDEEPISRMEGRLAGVTPEISKQNRGTLSRLECTVEI